MLSRRMTSAVVLLIGGCTQREEHGALSSVEEVSFQRTSGGVQLLSRIVGDLQEARRSPSVFVEKHGILVVGGCLERGNHLRTAERFYTRGSSFNSGSLFSNVIEAKSCAASWKLNDNTGAIIGGFNGADCLKSVELIKLNDEEPCSTSLHDIPFRLKNSVAVGLTNGDVLLFGGWDESRTMKTVFRLSFDECHTSLDTKMETMLPSEVEAHSCVVHGDYVYIIGGYDGISVVDSIVRYSISNRTSEVIPTRLSTARENHVSELILDRYVVVMAGWDGRQALDSVEIFECVEESPYLIPVETDFKLSQARIRPASVVPNYS